MALTVTELISFLQSEHFFSKEKELKLQLLSDSAFQNDLRLAGKNTLKDLNSNGRRPAKGFRVMPSYNLSPLNHSYKCGSYRCRISYAKKFARRYALFADQIILTDEIAAYLANTEMYDTNALLINIDVLKTLLPLIDAGAIKLTDPGVLVCEECMNEQIIDFGNKIGTYISSNVYDVFAKYDSEGVLSFSSEMLFSDSNLGFGVKYSLEDYKQSAIKLSSEFRKLTRNELEYFSPLLAQVIKRLYKETFLDASIAEEERLLLINSMRISNLCLSHFRQTTVPNFPISSEPARMFDLPYIEGLSIEQIVKLRELADASLQSLRCLLEERLLLNPHASPDTDIPQIVAELRRDIIETKQKLISLELKPKNKIEELFVALGTSMVLYGIASNVPAVTVAAVAPIIASIGIMNKNRKEHEKAECEIKSSPAYALLTAKELLQCSDPN